MPTTRQTPIRGIALIVIALFFAQLACSLSANRPTPSAAPTSTRLPTRTPLPTLAPQPPTAVEATAAQPSETPTPEAQSGGNESANAPLPTESPVPAATSVALATDVTADAKPLELLDQGFGQNGMEIGYAFIVQNPNPEFAFESAQYHISAYDAAGALVTTESGYMEVILPSQKTGFGGMLSVDEGITVTNIKVQITSGDAQVTDVSTPFTVDHVTYQPNYSRGTANGIITNPYGYDIPELQVSAVLYDQAGKIVGGGNSFANFILANGQTGTSVWVIGTGDAVKAELYPNAFSLNDLTSGQPLPDGAQALKVVKQGFGQNDTEAGYGALVQNPNSGLQALNSVYHVNFYDADGNIVYVEDGTIYDLPPGQTLGVGGKVYIGENTTVARMDFQIKTGDLSAAEPSSRFVASKIVFKDDPYDPQISGEIANPYTKDVTNLVVSAIAYNQAGEIIGGGSTYLDFIPAGDSMAVEVSVTTSEPPAKSEIYASLTSLPDK